MIFLRTYNYAEYRRQGGKFRPVSRLISLRSGDYTHSEIEFSKRYNNVSVSATLEDGCCCVRFKKIGYSNTWWEEDPIHCSEREEDALLDQALADADVSKEDFLQWLSISDGTLCLYGTNAKRYDTKGVAISFILPMFRIWRPHDKWVWCSEECKNLISTVTFYRNAWKDGVPADETTPERLLDDVKTLA
jgi:hypothetical protein